MELGFSLELQRSRRLDCCDAGLFLYRETLGFKSEYGEYYCVSTGEKFWGGCETKEELNALVVTPLYFE